MMSANVETMFSGNRVVPWHGLGEVVDGTLTSKEAIIKAGLDWQVIPTPIYTPDKREIANYKANIRSSDGKVLGIVTDKYKIVQNSEAFDFTDSLIGENCQYETAGSLAGGKRIFLLAKMPETKILGEDYAPYICFTNSHDGTGAIKAVMTPIRVVCQNTLNLALKDAKRSWSTKHMGNLQAKLKEAENTLFMAEKYMSEFAVTADQLAHTKITDDEVNKIIDDIYPVKEDDSDRKKRNVEDIKNQFTVCMLAPDILKYRNTAYGVVNAASDFATHVTPKRLTQNYRENNFGKILDGHVFIDRMFLEMMKKVKAGVNA